MIEISKLTVVGLGPGGFEYLTQSALGVLKNADVVYVRTIEHPLISDLENMGIKFSGYDYMYQQSENFDDVYLGICDDIANKSCEMDVVYAVPGSPFVAEKTVETLIKMQKEAKWSLETVYGVSFIDAMLNVLRHDPVNGLKILNALEIEKHIPDANVDNIVIQMYDRITASRVKIALLKVYTDEQPVKVVRGAGVKGEQEIRDVCLYEIDAQDGLYDHLTSLFIPKVQEKDKQRYSFDDLVAIMNRLRSPEGCPWDRKQTHITLKQYLIEECYEVLNAIDNEDYYELEEELGDVMLQIVFHSCIAEQNGFFEINDVITAICEKMIRRHPHVFGDIEVNDSQTVIENWEKIKKDEKSESMYVESMERIPASLPALMRAYKIQEKAANVGFDWENVDGALDKLKEELNEFIDELSSQNIDNMKAEMGDVLFSLVNICRILNIQPELALGMTNEKFLRRFRYIEEELTKNGEGFSEKSLDELDKYWEKAKKQQI